MAEHLNFYENLKEANMRLRGTIVLYDNEPFYVMCITNHKTDGIFRVWLDPIGRVGGMNVHRESGRPPFDKYATEDAPGGALGTEMDKWLEKNPKSGVERKMMNSPKFNKFRPFPIGMINIQGKTNFVERHPTRKVEQGLTKSAILEKPIALTPQATLQVKTDILSPEFRATILGEYPDKKECLARMVDPNIANLAVGFDRHFAMLRGPLASLFIAYKSDVVGFLPDNDFKTLRLGKDWTHTKEAIADLRMFDKIVV